jgi:hypothetical protein
MILLNLDFELFLNLLFFMVSNITHEFTFFFRQARLDLRVAVSKVEELTKVTEGLQEQMLKKVH